MRSLVGLLLCVLLLAADATEAPAAEAKPNIIVVFIDDMGWSDLSAKQSRQAPIFWRRPPDRPGTPDEPNPDLAVRSGNWKFYLNYSGRSPQLYDLASDIGESTNVADRHPELVTELTRQVLEWNAGMPADAGALGRR